MRWFRFYAEVVHDPKVQQLPDKTFKQWINLLCIACDNEGVLPPEKDIAFTMRMSVQACRLMLIQMRDLGLLDQQRTGEFKPHNWESRQFQSDVSTERVRKFRERRKQSSEIVSETFQKLPRARDSDTDTEQKQSQIQKQSDLQRAFLSDPSFAEFHRICTERGVLGASDEDWMWAYHSWKVLDFEQKGKALHDVETRNAQSVEIASPALPQNYVKSKKWNRPQLNGRTLSRAEEWLRDA